jgi:hypothetical protein
MTKPVNRKAAFIAAFFILHYSLPAISETMLSAGARREFIHYTEYTRDNSFLDSDKGALNGNLVSVRHILSKWTGILSITESSGTLDYNSINASSTSSIDQNTFQISLLRSVYSGDKTRVALGIKHEKQTYMRNISSTQRLFGLNEKYKYQETGVLGELEHKFSDTLSLAGKVSYSTDTKPTIDVKFLSEDFDDTKITLGRTNTREASLALIKAIHSRWLLKPRIAYSHQTTERSSRKQLTLEGQALNNFATAPRSENESWGISFTISYRLK